MQEFTVFFFVGGWVMLLFLELRWSPRLQKAVFVKCAWKWKSWAAGCGGRKKAQKNRVSCLAPWSFGVHGRLAIFGVP